MLNNIRKYEHDLEHLIIRGGQLQNSMYFKCMPSEFEEQFKRESPKDDFKKFAASLPNFDSKYQSWYSEAIAVVKLVLPDRIEDFVQLYEKPKGRKQVSFENYSIEDSLTGLTTVRGWGKEKIVGPEAAIPRFQQQLAILQSCKKRFESSLFDIKELLQADLFDSELEAAKELNKKGFVRGAGAIAGVVLESHLAEVCASHGLKVTKSDPGVNDLNQLLKDNNVIDIAGWRFIQHLADLRNKCDHKKISEPTKADIKDLIEGVDKMIKTIF